MPKILSRLGVLLLVCVLSACNQLTQLTLSEQELNDYVLQRVHYQKKLGVSGLANADITLSDLQMEIGRAEPNKVMVTGRAKVELSSLVGNQTATLLLTLKTQPVYDSEQGAIYLRELEIVEHSVKPEKLASMIGTLIPYLNNSMKLFFDKTPVYVLDPEKSKIQGMAKKLAKGLEVKPGRLIIPFTEG